MRMFEFRSDEVEKFFGIDLVGRMLTVRYGRIGTDGETKSRAFSDEIEAVVLYDHLVAEKLGKGYVEVAKKVDGTFDNIDQFQGDDKFRTGELPVQEFVSKKQKKKSKSKNAPVAPSANEADAKPKRRKRSQPSVISMVLEIASGPFWRSAFEHLLFMTGVMAFVGGLIGFLVGLVRSAAVAGLLFNLIGIPMLLLAYFSMSYPLSCFWKVIVGSAVSGEDIHEWPESSMGEWVFDMFFVMYLIALSIFISAGIAKLRESVIPGQLPSSEYWQLIGTEDETNKVVELPKILGMPRPPALEVKSGRPVLQPGPAWWTTFGAFVVVFPIVVISCLDSNTPIFIPWSPRVLFSLLTNFPAWLISFVISGGILGLAAVVFVLGSKHAPFWTFTLCSPLAALGMLIYGRVLGRLSGQISRT